MMSTTIRPEAFAVAALSDIECALADAYSAVDDGFDYDRLRRAFDDIAVHVEAWKRGPANVEIGSTMPEHDFEAVALAPYVVRCSVCGMPEHLHQAPNREE